MPYFFTILLYGIFTLLFVGQCIYIINGGVKMFEISKYKKSNVKLSIRLPENMNELLRKIALPNYVLHLSRARTNSPSDFVVVFKNSKLYEHMNTITYTS